MGIPSYYKRLIDSVHGLVRKTHPGSIDWLWMDFNCMIYHCLRRPDAPVYPCADWEKLFVDSVAKYLLHIVNEVKPQKGVYIAIDGVVPMAKMRQQRIRRFKSSWLAQNGLSEGGGGWDTNSITPGTQFMEVLRKRLEVLCAKHSTGKLKFILSSSNEPGEGEHKLMDMWRLENTTDTYAVYGLDADLIVLSLLNAGNNPVWLFREQIESGVVLRDAVGDEFYCWLSIDQLRTHIQGQIGDHSIDEYCFAMSVLGNDFLPASLSFKMRDDGHDALLECLQTLQIPLLSKSNEINWIGLESLISWLASSEESRIERFIGKKIAMSHNYVGLPLGDNNWPLEQKEEATLMMGKRLSPNWRTQYYQQWLGGDDNRRTLCANYIYGIQWIWSYYRGLNENICFNWFYSEGLPPLWSDLLNYIQKDIIGAFPGTVRIRREDIRPIEQLCLVLPLESWHLLGSNREKELVQKAPWLFPESFGFSSVGKRFFWECEADIPVPSICEVKAILG